MLASVPPTDCMVARAAVSARLDAELPDLDEARLDQHLRGCAECRTYAVEVAAIAVRLRGADLEQPTTEIFTPRRRRMPVFRLQAAAAAVALVAVATGSSFVLGRALGGHGSRTATVIGTADVLSLRADSTQQHLLAMIRRLEPTGLRNAGRAIAL
jgi:predicted anti-sigma-YlaC factor YlaD